jgi:ATPase family associated with various cellular activities (AAA)
MRPTLAAEAITKCLAVRQPIFVWGPPGAGKSSVVREIAKNTGKQLIDLRLSLLDSVDLRGFPHMHDGRMHFATPSFLPTDPNSEGVLFLDEMNVAPPAVQAAAYQLVLDRKVGEYQLPDGWSIIAAGNRETDQGVTYTMPAPLANRFVHADFDVHFDDWRQWAINHKLRSEVVNFISFRPGLLMDFDPDKRAFPTPRSWEFVSRVIDSSTTGEVERALISGAVGDGAAAELAGFLKIFRTLPNPDMVLMNPSKADVPTDPATLYALCGALSERASEANFDRLIEYCERIKPEFQVLCIRDTVTRNRDLAQTKTFAQWAVKNASVLI